MEVETSEVQVSEGRAIYVRRDWKGEGGGAWMELNSRL